MTSIMQLDPKALVGIIFALSAGKDLSTSARYEIAYFLDDVFSEGIEYSTLVDIIQNAQEFNSFDDLLREFMGTDEIMELEEEAGDEDTFMEEVIERIQEDNDCTILRCGKEAGRERFVIIH